MPRVARLPIMALLAALLVALILPGLALAHERRTVGGKYQFVVGFLSEPAFADQMNGLDLRVSTSADNKPVEGLEKTLKATVIVGGGAKSMDLTLQTRFGQPGAYAAYFMPTRAGSYIFRITGTIDGTPVDERFESGPGRFNDVESAQPLQFPDRLPDGLAAAAEVRAARDEADSARLLGIGGLILGLVGAVTGGLALAGARRGARSAPARETAQGTESHTA
ncbi:MAG TPA: hypothetical protein VF960_14685 [Chloroflexota bacterium]